jgi:flagellar biogenesis protein FliO
MGMKEFSALTIFPKGATKAAPRRRKANLPIWRQWINKGIAWMKSRHFSKVPRRLRLCETISLGEKRFAAVIEFDDRRFLLGGAATSVSLLAELRQNSFSSTLAKKKKSPIAEAK